MKEGMDVGGWEFLHIGILKEESMWGEKEAPISILQKING